MNKTAFVAVVALVAVGVVLLVGPGNIVNVFKRALPPNVEVTYHSGRGKSPVWLVDPDWTVTVDVSVYNKGGPGTVTVWVELPQDSESWKKGQTIHLEPEEAKELTFEFKGGQPLGSWIASGRLYRVSVEY